MDVDWKRYPHLEDGLKAALTRMSHALGNPAAQEVLRMSPQRQVERLNAFINMEQMYAATAQQAFEEAQAQLRKEAEEQLRSETQRLVDERLSHEAQRFAAEKARLEEEAQIRVQMAESGVAATVQAAVAAALAANAQQQARTSEPRPRAIKLEVPKYSGKDSENLEHWFLAVETAATAQLISEESMAVLFALSHLAGRAKEWAYSKRMLDANAFPDWSSFCLQLRQTFEPPDSQLRYRARLLSCKQGKRTLHEFVQELQFLRAALTSETLSESMLVSIFLEGLRQGPARLQLFRDVPKTLDDAIRIAHMEEYSHRNASRGSSGNGPSPMDLNGMQLNPKLPGVCHNCGKPGHWARRCKFPKQRGDKEDSKTNPKKAPIPASKGTTFGSPRKGNGDSQ
jgi:Retrotransposon gag protein/Zinc knuckle